ncbi:MAG: hypothetical protein IE880_05725 [Epsilonproteobacteria bacterium]|nr:hypothetical protein [Campylobacterota bacterium]
MFKEFIHTGFGIVAAIGEKVEEELKKLEEKGKIKTEDTKSFLKSLEEKGIEEEQKFKDNFKRMIKEVLDDLGVATKEDIEKLKEDLK